MPKVIARAIWVYEHVKPLEAKMAIVSMQVNQGGSEGSSNIQAFSLIRFTDPERKGKKIVAQFYPMAGNAIPRDLGKLPISVYIDPNKSNDHIVVRFGIDEPMIARVSRGYYGQSVVFEGEEYRF